MDTSRMLPVTSHAFETISYLACDLITQHDDCIPCLFLNRNSDGYRAFKALCLGATGHSIRWEIPCDPTILPIWRKRCRQVFGQDGVWYRLEPCGSPRIWETIEKMDEMDVDVYALTRDHMFVILIRAPPPP